MIDPFVLLRIAADLHAAGRDPARWPTAWDDVCNYFVCPGVLGEGLPAGLSASAAIDHIAARTARARACVEARSGACAKSDGDSRFRSCHELLPHLEMALGGWRPTAQGDDLRLAALDALPFPVFVCDGRRRLLHANAAGEEELARQTWLRRAGERLTGATSPIESRLAAVLTENAEDDVLLSLLRPGHADADLMLRRVRSADSGSHWILRLASHTRESDDCIPRLTEMLGLTLRQAELAQLLVAGCTPPGAWTSPVAAPTTS